MTFSPATATTSPWRTFPLCRCPATRNATRRIVDAQDGAVVLVGHSDGGAVITEAGTDEKPTASAYIAAFVPDAGESVNTLGGNRSIGFADRVRTRRVPGSRPDQLSQFVRR